MNVVDNAIYWITSDKRKERVIRLDAQNGSFEISNSGPGIERRLADQIFDYGMTTKVGGRGLGLYISREALRRGGYDMTVETRGVDSPPVFRIAPTQELVKSEVEE